MLVIKVLSCLSPSIPMLVTTKCHPKPFLKQGTVDCNELATVILKATIQLPV